MQNFESSNQLMNINTSNESMFVDLQVKRKAQHTQIVSRKWKLKRTEFLILTFKGNSVQMSSRASKENEYGSRYFL
jgi:hypothetical protein